MRGYLGNSARNRPNKNRGGGGQHGGGQHGGHGQHQHGNRSGNTGRPDDMQMDDMLPEGEDLGIIAPSDLAQSRAAMNLTQLKLKPVNDLVDLATKMGLENMGRSRKQDIIFSILKAHARMELLRAPINFTFLMCIRPCVTPGICSTNTYANQK